MKRKLLKRIEFSYSYLDFKHLTEYSFTATVQINAKEHKYKKIEQQH